MISIVARDDKDDFFAWEIYDLACLMIFRHAIMLTPKKGHLVFNAYSLGGTHIFRGCKNLSGIYLYSVLRCVEL